VSGPAAAAQQRPGWSGRFLDRVESFGTFGAVGAVGAAGAPVAVDTGDTGGTPGAAGPPPVLGLEIVPGSVRAQVPDSGAEHEAAEVWIELPVFDQVQWTRAEQAIAADEEVRECLLDGEVPARIEAVLARAGLSLLPVRARDLVAECSCPLWSPACPHVVAVLIALAAAFDRDPFALLCWRGRDRSRLLRHLHELRASAQEAAEAAAADAAAAAGAGSAPDRPLAACVEDFWREGDRHGALRAATAGSPREEPGESAPAVLGPSGILVRGRPLEALLQPAYRALRDE
jgi:uncharacterized Zn finger protein